MIKQYLKLIRINHWLKNILVYIPLFFGGQLFNTKLVLNCTVSFFAFSFVASTVYIINDIKDVEIDKIHEIKKKRPIASGKISIKKAIYTTIILLLAASCCIAYLYCINKNVFIIIIPILYLTINVLYSMGLKNVPIIDLIILVSGFVLRIIYGGCVTKIVLSKYLYLMVVFASYYMSLGKRRGEYDKPNIKKRAVLEKYNKAFLDKNMYVAYALSIMSYTLWCVDYNVIERFGHDYLYCTVPLLVIIFQFYSLDIEKDCYGDPIDVISSNKILIAFVSLYAIIMLFLIYII